MAKEEVIENNFTKYPSKYNFVKKMLMSKYLSMGKVWQTFILTQIY